MGLMNVFAIVICIVIKINVMITSMFINKFYMIKIYKGQN